MGGYRTNCCSGVFVAGSLALPGDVSEVAGDGVREAPGNRALYISFLRGFPTPMRREDVGAPERSVDDERDGGGMLVEDEMLTGDGTLTVGKTLAGSGMLAEDEIFAGDGMLTVGGTLAGGGMLTDAGTLIEA